MKGQRVRVCVSVSLLAGIITQCLGMATAAAGEHKRRKNSNQRKREKVNDGVSVELKKSDRESEQRGQNRSVLKQRGKCVTQGRVRLCVCVMNSRCDMVLAQTRRQSKIRGFKPKVYLVFVHVSMCTQ